MDLDLSFGENTMCTPVYIKMDAREQLLLSEGVCRQLNIVKYHPDVELWRGGRKQSRNLKATEQEGRDVTVPTVRLSLVQSIRLPPGKSTHVEVQPGPSLSEKPLLLEYDCTVEETLGVQIPDALLQPSEERRARLVMTNPSGYTQVVEPSATLGEATPAMVVEQLPPALSIG